MFDRLYSNIELDSMYSVIDIRTRICNVWGAQESITRKAYVAWRAGTSNRAVVSARHVGNRFLGSLKGLQIQAQ
jgi:hypothetical protein